MLNGRPGLIGKFEDEEPAEDKEEEDEEGLSNLFQKKKPEKY